MPHVAIVSVVNVDTVTAAAAIVVVAADHQLVVCTGAIAAASFTRFKSVLEESVTSCATRNSNLRRCT